MQTVTPEISTVPLRNPGKGWLLYGMPDQHRNGSLPYGSVGYTRFNWCTIEPKEGEFNWKPIDEFIAAWSKEGLQVAFGVMTANIHFRDTYVTPRWVFDAGCGRREVQQKNPKTGAKDVAVYYQYEGMQVIPKDWIDPVYIKKLEAFLTAMARRYDGNPSLAWYEIRSYGNWGEGHLWPWEGNKPSPDQIFEHHIQLHRRIFTKTPLMAAESYFLQTAENRLMGIAADQAEEFKAETYFRTAENRLRAGRIGVGVRDDGVISFRDGSTTAESDGLAPSCFEWGGSYAQFSSEGVMAKLEDCVRNGHVYYCGFARSGADDIKAFAANEKALIERLTNLMGYHLVIEKASLPKTIVPDEAFPLTVTWRNDGVAKIWFPCSVAMALLDNRGKCVSRAWLDKSNPGACPGGQTRTEMLEGKFDTVPAGSYRIAIGLFRDRNSMHPDVKLGLKNITEENWHPLATVTQGSK